MIKYYRCNIGGSIGKIFKTSIDNQIYVNINNPMDFGVCDKITLDELVKNGVLEELSKDELIIKDIIE
jgi:hypothetical protein